MNKIYSNNTDNIKEIEGIKKYAYRLNRSYNKSSMRNLRYTFRQFDNIPFQDISKRNISYIFNDISVYKSDTKFKHLGYKKLDYVFNRLRLNKYSCHYQQYGLTLKNKSKISRIYSLFRKVITPRMSMERISQYRDKEDIYNGNNEDQVKVGGYCK